MSSIELVFWMNSYFLFPSHNLHWIQKWSIVGGKILKVGILSNSNWGHRIMQKRSGDVKDVDMISKLFPPMKQYLCSDVCPVSSDLFKTISAMFLWMPSLNDHVEDEKVQFLSWRRWRFLPRTFISGFFLGQISLQPAALAKCYIAIVCCCLCNSIPLTTCIIALWGYPHYIVKWEIENLSQI